jgi:hypothetical protein
MKTEYLIGGYLDGKEVPKNRNFGFDGKKLDLLVISGILSSKKDCEELIQILKTHINCFNTPQYD